MHNISTYIIEKLKINKDSKVEFEYKYDKKKWGEMPSITANYIDSINKLVNFEEDIDDMSEKLVFTFDKNISTNDGKKMVENITVLIYNEMENLAVIENGNLPRYNVLYKRINKNSDLVNKIIIRRYLEEI